MFDEINNKNSANDNMQSPPAGIKSNLNNYSPRPTEDIFAEVDRGIKPPVFQPKTPPPGANTLEPEHNESSGNKKFFILGIIVVAAVLIFAGGIFGYNKYVKKSVPPVNEKTAGEAANAVNNEADNISINPAEETNQPALINATTTGQSLDSDQDGLTDEEEKNLGINPNSVDSDSDGLFDREEVKTYGTDPLKADTDGDGFLDGDEVKNGYNPNGPGKLYELNR